MGLNVNAMVTDLVVVRGVPAEPNTWIDEYLNIVGHRNLHTSEG